MIQISRVGNVKLAVCSVLIEQPHTLSFTNVGALSLNHGFSEYWAGFSWK